MKKILVIDDDIELTELLKEYFTVEGFLYDCAHNGRDGLEKLFSSDANIVILDVMLPEQDGFEVLREIRAVSTVPVVMLTARVDHTDRVVGLEMGADDYICKPFNTRELAARIRAVLRRVCSSKGPDTCDVIRVGDLEIDLRSRSVTVGGRDVSLTNIEFRILEDLASHAGAIVTFDKLSLDVLKRRYSAFDRSLSVHMSNLRKKIGPQPNGDERIATIRGEGFICVWPKNLSNAK